MILIKIVYSQSPDHIGVVMVSMLLSIAVDCGFWSME